MEGFFQLTTDQVAPFPVYAVDLFIRICALYKKNDHMLMAWVHFASGDVLYTSNGKEVRFVLLLVGQGQA